MAWLSRKKIIYYPGNTLTKYFPEIVQNWKSILSDFGLRFELVEDLSSGWPLWNQGYTKQFEEHLARLRQRVDKENIGTIITSSPEAHYIFKTYLPEVESKHTTQVAFEHLPKIQQFNTGQATWHDNTTQARRNGIQHQPRRVLVQAGFTVRDYDESKQETQCMGTSTGLVNNSPRLATKLAQRRLRKTPTQPIITDSPEDYLHLKRLNDKAVLELSEVLVEI